LNLGKREFTESILDAGSQLTGGNPEMKKMLFAAVASAFIATAASAAVIFDSNTGFGFVGKGDVQLLYGWNNQKLQQNAEGVSFYYDAVDTYDVTCEWTTTTGGPNPQTIVHDVTVPRHTSVSSTIAYESRKNSNGLNGPVTGFNLNGFGSTTTHGTVPVIGGSCPGASALATIVDVQQTGSTGGLVVSFGGTSYPLPNTPTI
jgi:hypothetical protein